MTSFARQMNGFLPSPDCHLPTMSFSTIIQRHKSGVDLLNMSAEVVRSAEGVYCPVASLLQKIQTITAVDADDPGGGHRFFFTLAPESLVRPNFTLKDNQGSPFLSS